MLLLGCGILLIVLSPKEETPSEYENRMLEAFPSLKIENIFSGGFAQGMERYLSDHFAGRQKLIELSGRFSDSLSLLSKEQQAKLTAMDVPIDSDKETSAPISDEPGNISDLPAESDDSLANEQDTGAGSDNAVIESPAPVPEQPGTEQTSEPEQDTGLFPKTETVSTVKRNPLVDYDYRKDLNRDERVFVNLIKPDGSKVRIADYRKWYIRDAANLFNRLADLLPEDGHMYVALAQRGEHVIQYTQALDRYTAYESEAEDYLESLLKDRITVFRTMEILEPHIRNGEYVYFFSDHHWTVLGAYYVHQAMMESTGRKAAAYEDYKVVRQGQPYSGTNAQIAELLMPKGTKDFVDMIEPSVPYDFYRVENITELTPYPLNNSEAYGYQAILWLNMRPWKMIRGYENTGRKMLLVCDSMGMAFAPFMLNYYDEVHIVRPHTTYYSIEQAGGTIKEYFDYYGIDDIYVIQSNFFTGDLYRQELRRSIGDGK